MGRGNKWLLVFVLHIYIHTASANERGLVGLNAKHRGTRCIDEVQRMRNNGMVLGRVTERSKPEAGWR